MPGIKEQKKKLQRSVLYWMEHCPPEKVLPELLKLKQTVDALIEIIQPTTFADIGLPVLTEVELAKLQEVAANTLVIDGEVA